MHASRLSPIVKQLGYTGLPLSRDEFSKLQETIRSTAPELGAQRLNLPPVTYCCAHCKKPVVQTAADYMKQNRQSRSGQLFCGKKCAAAVKIGNEFPRCRDCGACVGAYGRVRCAPCRVVQLQAKKAASEARRSTQCVRCGVIFASAWKAGFQSYCGKDCADGAHADRMLGAANPNWRGEAAKWRTRTQPHSRHTFRYARIATLARDRHMCQLCGLTTDLEVHHVDHDPFNNAWSNLLTLCRPCHMRHHRSRLTTKQKKIESEALKSLTAPFGSLTFRSKRMRAFLRAASWRTTAPSTTI